MIMQYDLMCYEIINCRMRWNGGVTGESWLVQIWYTGTHIHYITLYLSDFLWALSFSTTIEVYPYWAYKPVWEPWIWLITVVLNRQNSLLHSRLGIEWHSQSWLHEDCCNIVVPCVNQVGHLQCHGRCLTFYFLWLVNWRWRRFRANMVVAHCASWMSVVKHIKPFPGDNDGHSPLSYLNGEDKKEPPHIPVTTLCWLHRTG